MATVVVDSVARADTEVDKVDTEVAEAKVVKLATHAAGTATCLVCIPLPIRSYTSKAFQVTAPKAKSATTVVRSVISPETAQLRTTTSELATSASSQATSRLNALTKPSVRLRQ